MKEPDTQAAFGIGDEPFGLVPGHPRKVINIELAFAAKAFALVAVHLVPVGRARAGDLDIIQRAIKFRHNVLRSIKATVITAAQ